MAIDVPAQVLFELVDNNIDYWAKKIRHDTFSLYRDIPWTPEQRKMLEPMLRAALEEFVQWIFGNFGNVGAVIPDNSANVIGYTILAQCWDHGGDGALTDIPIGDGYTDYSDLWWEYLHTKHELLSGNQ